jgi:hypothetical protein
MDALLSNFATIASIFNNLPVAGLDVVSGVNGVTGAVTITEGTGINVSTSGNTIAITATGSSGDGGTPGGSNGQVQFNSNGALAGAAGLLYDQSLLSLAEGQTTATGQCSHAEGQGNAGAWQTGEHTEGVAINDLKAARSHLTLQLDSTAAYGTLGSTGELKIGGPGGQRIAIPAGWTYSFDFNIQAVDQYFNASTWRGWGTVQNTGAVVAGTLDGLKLLSASNSIVPVYWAQDGQITTNSAIQAAPGGPGTELPQLFLIFDTSSSTGEVVVRVGGNDTYLNFTWYALFTINKLYQTPGAGST